MKIGDKVKLSAKFWQQMKANQEVAGWVGVITGITVLKETPFSVVRVLWQANCRGSYLDHNLTVIEEEGIE